MDKIVKLIWAVRDKASSGLLLYPLMDIILDYLPLAWKLSIPNQKFLSITRTHTCQKKTNREAKRKQSKDGQMRTSDWQHHNLWIKWKDWSGRIAGQVLVVWVSGRQPRHCLPRCFLRREFMSDAQKQTEKWICAGQRHSEILQALVPTNTRLRLREVSQTRNNTGVNPRHVFPSKRNNFWQKWVNGCCTIDCFVNNRLHKVCWRYAVSPSWYRWAVNP